MSVKFYKYKRPESVSRYLAGRIVEALDGSKKVLWLVAGGSAMDIAAQTANRLRGNKNLGNLAVSLTDERYGPVGHADSNWRQLTDKGFSLEGARFLPVLDGQEPGATAAAYADMLSRELERADFSLALAGMGPDGHIFGIKPGSPSVTSRQTVIAYDWDDYRRLTPTLELIKRLDEIDLFVSGREKHSQLDKLAKDIPPGVQPAQLLKRAGLVKIYNDYKGEPV